MRTMLVCGRSDAEGLPARSDWAVISIHDPGSERAALKEGWHEILHLTFHDKEDEFLAMATGLWKLFSPDQAHRCWEFVSRQQPYVKGLLVHCNAGLSRSPAIARAICEHLNLRPDDSWPSGNGLVRRLMADTVTTVCG